MSVRPAQNPDLRPRAWDALATLCHLLHLTHTSPRHYGSSPVSSADSSEHARLALLLGRLWHTLGRLRSGELRMGGGPVDPLLAGLLQAVRMVFRVAPRLASDREVLYVGCLMFCSGAGIICFCCCCGDFFCDFIGAVNMFIARGGCRCMFVLV